MLRRSVLALAVSLSALLVGPAHATGTVSLSVVRTAVGGICTATSTGPAVSTSVICYLPTASAAMTVPGNGPAVAAVVGAGSPLCAIGSATFITGKTIVVGPFCVP